MNDDFRVQWFPGHMAKARREIENTLRLVDLALEVCDARIPLSSRNPDFERLLGSKQRLVLLNKSDLSHPSANEKWRKWFESRGVQAVVVDARSGDGFVTLWEALRVAGRNLQASLKDRGRLGRNLRILVAGAPNVGKSSVLNRLAGRKAARTGDVPGVTRGKQWIHLPGQVDLLDSPGLLPPKIPDRRHGMHLALVGTIPEGLVDTEALVKELLSILSESYPNALSQRYGNLETADGDDLLAVLAQKKGCLLAGGRPDYARTARMVLDDFRSGRLGRITLEHPPA